MVDSAAAVQAKAYFTSKENQLLVPNSDFGRRKFVNVQTSTPSRAGFQGPNQTAVQSYSRFQKQEQQEDPDVDYTDLDMKKSGTRQWIHPPDTLLKGHIVYNVKFLGHVEVESPKGTEVVRDAIRKMKFNKQIKKAEGHKPKKVELTVSIDGVTVQGIKTKEVYHQYPLHRISYCADDKADKRMFTFIAKEADTPGHHCFVFDSDKCAEEITLTVGQAFDLAYRRFLDSSSKDMDVKKQYLLCQKQVQELTTENLALKSRVAMLERLVDPSTPGYHDTSKPVGNEAGIAVTNGNAATATKQDAVIPPKLPPPVQLQRSTSREQPVVGRRLENLVLEDSEPPAFPQPVVNGNHAVPALAPPPHVPTRNNVPVLPTMQPQSQQPSRDMFGAEPFTPPAVSAVPRRPSAGPDPFGMGEFSPSPQSLDQQIQKVDSELMDLQSGFSRGLAFGTEDFSIEDLDPLSKK